MISEVSKHYNCVLKERWTGIVAYLEISNNALLWHLIAKCYQYISNVEYVMCTKELK
jgi:hypothetical protein